MIEINNLTKNRIAKNFLKKVAKIVINRENIKRANLSIALITSKEIKKINKKYRRKNKTTDVLSFPGNSKLELGEILICPSEVRKNAKKFGLSFKKELAFVLIHGILHLLGYEHEKTKKEAKNIRGKEEYYLSKV